jgi:hypothetical protein
MAQVHRSIVAQPIPLKQERYGLAAAITAGIAAAFVAGVFIFSSVTSAPTAVRTPGSQNLDQLVDGWMPAVAAAQAARLARMRDGYLPGLLAARGSGDAVDGWASALTSRGQSSDIRDGWESALLH